MEPNRKSGRVLWVHRHAGLTVATCCLLGASIGFALAFSIPSEQGSYFWLELLRPVAFLAAAAAGTLVGALAGVLLIRVGGSGLKCPRCGTLNEDGAIACSACGLSLTYSPGSHNP